MRQGDQAKRWEDRIWDEEARLSYLTFFCCLINLCNPLSLLEEEEERGKGEARGGLVRRTSPSPMLIHFAGLWLSSFICALRQFPQRSPSFVLLYLTPSFSSHLFFCLWPNTDNGKDPKKTSEFIHFLLSLFDTLSASTIESHTQQTHTAGLNWVTLGFESPAGRVRWGRAMSHFTHLDHSLTPSFV